MKPLGIYIHIPFCVRKCLYCDFLSMPAPETVRARYMEALGEEMAAEAARYRAYRVSTVFVGGGTPSVLSAAQLTDIFSCLRAHYAMEAEAEITIEMNPGTVTEEKLAACREAGVNRISLGLQSADNRELKRIGRTHTWEDFLEAYRMCAAAGFANLNVDLISALPGQTRESWRRTLQTAVSLRPVPAHISAYSLIIEEGTPFYALYGPDSGGCAAGGIWPLPDEDTDRDMYADTGRILAAAGYGRYEISNYALPGRACRHNRMYWERGDYAGFGLGAASMADNRRWSNVRDMAAYLSLPADGKKTEIHRLSLPEQMEETMFLGLRMTRGVSRERFAHIFDRDMDTVYGPVLERYTAMGMLESYGGHVRLTDRGIDVSNRILADFLLT